MVEIKRGCPYTGILTITDDSVTPSVALNLTGLTVFISVKAMSHFADNDDDALITSEITSHTTPASGITTWQLTAAETLIAAGVYKADVRVYTSASDFINSDVFYVEIKDVVTKRLT